MSVCDKEEICLTFIFLESLFMLWLITVLNQTLSLVNIHLHFAFWLQYDGSKMVLGLNTNCERN